MKSPPRLDLGVGRRDDGRDRPVATRAPDPDGAAPMLPVLVRYDYDVFKNVIVTEPINSRIEDNQLVVTALTANFVYDHGNPHLEKVVDRALRCP